MFGIMLAHMFIHATVLNPNIVFVSLPPALSFHELGVFAWTHFRSVILSKYDWICVCCCLNLPSHLQLKEIPLKRPSYTPRGLLSYGGADVSHEDSLDEFTDRLLG